MSLAKIISIPGMSGLYKMIAQLRNGGFIVESFIDQKRIPVSSTQRIIMLEDISVYTLEEDMPLNSVLLKMKEKHEMVSNVTPQTSPADLRTILKKIVPEFDEERVHDSDIKKMFTWYFLLKDQLEEEPKVQEQEAVAAEVTEGTKKKGKAAEKATVAEEESSEKKPKAKKATKKEA